MRTRIRLVTALIGLIAVLGIAHEAVGQTLGVKVALVRASVTTHGEAAFGATARTTFAGGGFVGFPLGAYVRFQPEILLSVRRFSSATQLPTFVIEARGVEVPLLLQFLPPSSRPIRGVILLGPQLGVLRRVTQTIAGVAIDLTSQVRQFNPEFVVGAGAEIAAGRGTLVTDVRISFGLTDISRIPALIMHSRSFVWTAGVRF
jgi:hypothetical protein